MSIISKFVIHKLYGKSQNIELEFKDNTLILVGENGAGKTTILKIIFYSLSRQWQKLAMYNFSQIVITIRDRVFIINRDEIKLDISEKQLRNLPASIRKEIASIQFNDGLFREFELENLERLSHRYGISMNSIIDIIESQRNFSKPSKKNQSKFAEIDKILSDVNVLYLPTYRRIEEELNTIFRGVDEDSLISRNRRYHLEKPLSYTELIEFGMKDVERAIKNTLDSLKDFARESLNNLTLGYLGDVVDKKYTQVDLTQISQVSDESISNILNRIDTKILSDESKQHLYQTIDSIQRGRGENLSEHDKVICHYFTKLLYFQQDLEDKETKIKGFCDVCNKYIKSKIFEYDSTTFNFGIFAKFDRDDIYEEIQLSQLSSGEKQIVSLFSHLYLSTQNNYIVLIDEPELSLSVKWQREFLVDIRNGKFCEGLIAVTHSPFIFDNELRMYTHGIGEFYKELF